MSSTAEPAWAVDHIPVEGSARSVSFVLDPDRRPVVSAWLDVGTESARLLAFGEDRSGWHSSEVVRTHGAHTSTALDGDRTVHIAFVDLDRDELRVARRGPHESEWSIETVGPIGAFVATTPALVHTGTTAEVVYSTSAGLVLATRADDGTWATETIGPGLPSGLDVDYSIDGSGTRYVVYRDPFADSLVHMRRDDDGWTSSDIPWSTGEPAAFLGDGASLAVDAGGRPHVAFWRHDGIAYATLDHDVWLVETIIAGAGVGPAPTLAIGRDGRPAVASLDTTTGSVRVARRDDGGWQLDEVIAGQHDDSLASSARLVFDEFDVPHVAFVGADGTPYVARVDTAPVANPDTFVTQLNTVLRGNVLADDIDAEHDRLHVATKPRLAPRHGQLVLRANGGFTYTPAKGFNGVDRFRYELADDAGHASIGTVTITVEVPVLIRAIGRPLADGRKSSTVRTSVTSPSRALMTAVLQRRSGARWTDVRSGAATQLTPLVRPRKGEWSRKAYRVEMRHIDRGYPLVRSEEFDMPPARGRDLLLRGDLTALPRVEPRRPPTKQPPRASTPAAPPTTRSPAAPPTPAPGPPPAPPAFDPARGLWGLWPLNAHKPMIRRGARGDAVRYLQGVIAHKAGGNIAVDGVFEMQTWYRVQQVQAFFGILADGRVGDQTWPIIDQLAGS